MLVVVTSRCHHSGGMQARLFSTQTHHKPD
jgi:hypothetical protein